MKRRYEMGRERKMSGILGQGNGPYKERRRRDRCEEGRKGRRYEKERQR